jgi:DNA-binding transcriptional LysR family regulator
MEPQRPDAPLSAIDLNLVVALDALLAARSVTRAAGKIGLSQPAMSHALARLRLLFDDPLLVRTPRGMVPTPRAEDLIAPIRRSLAELERTLQRPAPFDPSTARRSFTVAAVDYSEVVVLPALLGRLSREAPGVDLLVRQLRMDRIDEELSVGTSDLAMGVLLGEERAGSYQQRLFQDRFVCVVRRDHPEVKETMTLEQYVGLRHALIAPRGTRGGLVEDALGKLGLSRRVVLAVPQFLVAPLVIAESDLVLTLAERLARTLVQTLPLRIVPLPLEMPGFSTTQFWHERQHQDPAQIWLRGVIAEICRSLAPAGPHAGPEWAP